MSTPPGQESIPLNTLRKNVSDALNEGLRQQHGTFEDGTARYQFRFVESEEINATAVNYFGVAVIKTPSGSPGIGRRDGTPPPAQETRCPDH